MRCPTCGFDLQAGRGAKRTSVKDSRTVTYENAIRRRRECPKCKVRWTTYERIESVRSGNVAGLISGNVLNTGCINNFEGVRY
jgi:transcriptional regulator NrdR family protein